MIAPGAVTAAKLAPGAVSAGTLAPDSVGAAALANNAVDTAALATGAVTRDKIAIGHALLWQTGQTRGDTLGIGGLNAEQVYLEYTWVSRGGPYVILAGLHCVMGVDTNAPAAELLIRIRADGTAATADGTILQEQRTGEAAMAGPVVPVTLTAAYSGTGATPTTHRVKVSAMSAVKFLPFVRILSGWSVMAEWS